MDCFVASLLAMTAQEDSTASTPELLLQRSKIDLRPALGDLAVADAPEGHAAKFEALAGGRNAAPGSLVHAAPDHAGSDGVALGDDAFDGCFHLAERGMKRFRMCDH